MEDTIEVCTGCGKMPRQMDYTQGFFLCSRCGGRSTMYVNSDEYEKVVSELDARFHAGLMKAKVDSIVDVPLSHDERAKPAKKPKARQERAAVSKAKPASKRAKAAPKKKESAKKPPGRMGRLKKGAKKSVSKKDGRKR